jgi:hypothetical protein
MALVHDFSRKEDYFFVVASGDCDVEYSIYMFYWVLDTCRLTGLSKVLIDYRNIGSKIAKVESILFAQGVIDKFKKYLKSEDSSLKISFLGTVSQVSDDPNIDMLKREGLPVIVTADPQEARSWLGVQE